MWYIYRSLRRRRIYWIFRELSFGADFGSIYTSCIEQSLFSQVPSLNDVPVHYLKPNSLVKFRCMVQDMFDPEFYMGVYETVDPNTNARVSEILIDYFSKCLSLYSF